MLLFSTVIKYTECIFSKHIIETVTAIFTKLLKHSNCLVIAAQFNSVKVNLLVSCE